MNCDNLIILSILLIIFIIIFILNCHPLFNDDND